MIKTSNQINVPVLVCFGGKAIGPWFKNSTRTIPEIVKPLQVSGPPFLLVWYPRTPLWCCSCSFSSSSSRSRSSSSNSSSSNNSSMRSRRRSKSSGSSRSRSERSKMVGPNPGAMLMFQNIESDGIFPVLYQQDPTSAGICPSTGRVVGAHANTYIIHIALILILILILTLILILFIILVILIIPSSYASSPHHTHHPLIILIIPSSYSSYSSYASYSSYSSSPSSWDVGHFSMKRIIFFSLREAAEPGRRGPCLWRASTFHLFLQINNWTENLPSQFDVQQLFLLGSSGRHNFFWKKMVNYYSWICCTWYKLPTYKWMKMNIIECSCMANPRTTQQTQWQKRFRWSKHALPQTMKAGWTTWLVIHQTWLPVVPHEAVAEVSRIGDL